MALLLLPVIPAAVPSAASSAAPGARPAAPTNCTSLYTVVKNDSWFNIAKKSNVSMNSLFQANGATATTPLFPGMQLCLPAGAAVTTSTTMPGATTVSGEQPVQLASFPTQGPCWFIDTWRAPRGGGRLHEGVDIMAKAGQYVYAVQAGTLTKQTVDRPGSLSGNAWWLTGADGSYYFYAHLTAFAADLRVGSKVAAGQVIGYVGRTGNASGAHLHFEVHPRGGAAVNPTPIVRAVDGCTTSTPPAQPSGTVPATPATLPPAGGGTPAPTPATTPPVATPPSAPVQTAPPVTAPSGTPAVASSWQFFSPRTAFDSTVSGRAFVAGVTQTVQVRGLSGVPAGTSGVLVRLTASAAAGNGYLVTHPCGSPAPLVSTLSFGQGVAAVGTSIVRVANGAVCVTASTRVQVKVELLAAQTTSGGVGLQPITANRVLDTRLTGRLAAGTQVTLANSALGVPAGAQALSMTVTFVDPAAAGTLSLGFCGQGPWKAPIAADGVSSFAMAMRVNSSGWCLSSSVATDMIVDVTGAWVGLAELATVDPVRVFDSRYVFGSGGVTNAGVAMQVAGAGGVPGGATNAVLALTLVAGGAGTSVFVYPCGESPGSGTVIAAMSNRVHTAVVPVRLGGGQVCVRSIHPADVIIDVTGAWVGPAKVATVDPVRVFDSRDVYGAGGVTNAGVPVQVAGAGGVPGGATNAVLALTLVTGGAGTSVFVHPCGESPGSGTVIAAVSNRVHTAVVPVRLGGGQVCVRSIHPADVIIDVVAAG